MYRGKTTNEDDIFKPGLVKFTQSDYDKFEDNVYYVVDAKGGADLDRNDDLVKDDTPTTNNGTIHAIISGADLKTVAFRVNALTEAIYQTNSDLLGSGYNVVKLNERLAQVAKKLFREKTFILNNELEINYHDALLWAPGVDKKKLYKPYDAFVEPIVLKTYADEPRVKESYRLIYEKVDTDAPQLSPLAIEIPQTIPNGSIIGKVSIVSEGNGIDHIELHGESNSSFSIDKEGLVKVVNSAEFTIDAIYKLDMIAIGVDNTHGTGAELVIKVLEGAPLANPSATVPTLQSVVLQDIIENSVGGTVVGKIEQLREGKTPITSFDILNHNVPFAIDVNGTIRTTGYINYEEVDEYNLLAIAKTQSGNGNRVEIQILIDDVSPETGKPTIQPFSASIDENANAGLEVGQLAIAQGESAIEKVELRGTGYSNFTVDTNGTIRVANNASLDYEQKSSYGLHAIAYNANGSSDLVAVNIALNDTDDEAPVLLGFTKNIDENATADTVVGTLTLSNKGEGNITSYALEGTGSENFNIDENGTIRISSSAALDYETTPSYTLQATAMSDVGESEPVDVRIFVLNVANDTLPVIKDALILIKKDTPSGTKIGRLNIYSLDSELIEIDVDGEGNDTFRVDLNGLVYLVKDVGANIKNSYSLTVRPTNIAGIGSQPTLQINIVDIIGTSANDTIVGGAGADTINAGEGDDTVNGGTDNDLISGDEGDDTLYGNQGADTLEGGEGNDTLRGGAGNDIYLFSRGDGHDTIYDYDRHGTAYGQYNAGSDILKFKGGILPNELIVRSSGNNLIVALKEDGVAFEDLSDVITITNWYIVNNRIETFLFEDGTTWDIDTILINLNN